MFSPSMVHIFQQTWSKINIKYGTYSKHGVILKVSFYIGSSWENVNIENNDSNYRTSPGYIEKLLRNPLLFQ